MRTSYFSGCPSYLIKLFRKQSVFSRQSKEEDYLAKCLHDTIVQNQQDSLQFALDNFYVA